MRGVLKKKCFTVEMKKEETNVCETWCNGHLAALLSYNREGLSLEAADCPTGSLLAGRGEPASTVLVQKKEPGQSEEMKGVWSLPAPLRRRSQADGKTWSTWMSSFNLGEQSWPSRWVGFSLGAQCVKLGWDTHTYHLIKNKIFFLAILSLKTL